MSTQSQDSTEAAQASESYIELDGLRKTFGGGSIIAIEDINLSIGTDEFVVLLGPSGCGKTTTLRCISGLEIPDEGSIRVDGEDITNEKPKDRDFAFVFQRIALFPHKSVRGNMRFGLDMKTDLSSDEKERRVREAAETLGIEEMLDRSPSELSGGQQQRVSVGRAMVMEPKAFLLDEPFSALDANLRDLMRTEIKKLQRQLGTSMIFVTHDQEEAMTLGDKIVVMDDAHIQQVGSPYEIYNEPTNQFVAEFIGSPSTNMIESDIDESGDSVTISNEVFDLPVEGEIAEAVSGLNSVTLGIRPEYLKINTDDPLFTADVTVIEPHGSQDAVFLDVGGSEIRVVTAQNTVERGQDTVTARFDAEDMWLFDDTGDRLY